MHDSDVYLLTELGERQLRGAGTTLTSEELELLVRVDGVLTVGAIRDGTKDDPFPDFDRLFRRLLNGGLVRLRAEDPFADRFEFKPTKSALKQAQAEADAGAASLQKHGFFVRIARRSEPRAGAAGRILRALIVEDDEHLAKFLAHYLDFEGFLIDVASSREQVVAALRRAPPPDLVLLDVMLPDADGFDILSKMRRHPALKTVPVIMLTAKATREAVIQGLAAGAQGYVTKPFEVDALVEAVRSVMGLPGDSGRPPSDTDPWPERAR